MMVELCHRVSLSVRGQGDASTNCQRGRVEERDTGAPDKISTPDSISVAWESEFLGVWLTFVTPRRVFEQRSSARRTLSLLEERLGR